MWFNVFEMEWAMRVGYARVSTGDQTTDLQTDAMTSAGCERIFQETASGAQRDRPELMKALEFLRAGDVLVVWKLDRLARSLRQLIDTAEELQTRGIGFVSITEGIDTTSAGGKLVFHIFGALAEFEREMIRERTKAGLKAAKSRGRRLGRPSALSENQVKMARSLKAAGDLSSTEIAKQLGVSRATLYRVLSWVSCSPEGCKGNERGTDTFNVMHPLSMGRAPGTAYPYTPELPSLGNGWTQVARELELIREHKFAAADFMISVNGACRLNPELARLVARP
jgi:DNA invertase Pin-like site-specific DNA recombinase